MERTLPAWGLYRLLKALGDKQAGGLLSLQFAGGRARFFLKQGFITDCQTDIVTLSFPVYLAESGMVPDIERAREIATIQRLVEERVVRSEDALRLHTNYVRSVLHVLLPEPVISWSFAPARVPGTALTEESVDICAELFTAVIQCENVSGMREVIERYGEAVKLTATLSPACVMHARAHFKNSVLVRQLLAGSCTVMNDEILKDEKSLRILFAFAVAGCLGSCRPDVPDDTIAVERRRPGRRNTRQIPRKDTTTESSGSPEPDERPEFAWPEFQEIINRKPGDENTPTPSPIPVIEPENTGEVNNSEDAAGEETTSDPGYTSLDVDGDAPEVGEDVFEGFGDAPRKPARKIRRARVPGEPPPVDPVMEDALNAEVDRAESLNHYELLEINADARLSAVRMAVLRARRRYSVSRYEGSVSAESLKKLNGLIERIEKAHEVLSDLDVRVMYNRSLGMSSPALESVLVAMFDARTMWQQGMEMLEQRRVNEAMERFENAESYDAEEPVYLCSQGMALLSMPPAEDTNETIESLIDVSFSFDQDLVEAHMLAANYMIRRNDYDTARTHIRKVLVMDPENREARAFKQKVRVNQVGAQVSFKKKQESIIDKALKLIKR